MRTAKNLQPYIDEELSLEDILDFKDNVMYGFNNRKNSNEVITIGKLKIVKFVKNEQKMFYKTSYEDTDFQFAVLKEPRNNRNETVVLKKLYSTKPKINEKKKRKFLTFFF